MSRETRALTYPRLAELSPKELSWLRTAYVEDNAGCWVWTRGRSRNGYAVAHIQGHHLQVHRLVYQLTYGPIPASIDVDHRCRNRACVNPMHLEAVTHGENVRRGFAAQRVVA